MGCDIHVHREKLKDGEWVTHDEWEQENEEYLATNNIHIYRDYELFGLLSEGVRYDIPGAFPQKGMPDDASDEVNKAYEAWDSDGHSHNYLGLDELLSVQEHKKGHVFLGAVSREVILLQPTVEDLVKQLFTQKEQENPENYRIVFWFDN